ncbi:helix-turn-helix transcriptional regulator [Paenibacillus sp. GCM10012306]|uniref:helix-turn-helix transcriptional regulator n=1 Tax=Paenibacillus sp. GCM10012306 TaxID=3317342 RepID=UPI00360879D0
MNIQDVILGLLSKEPHSGYEIKRHFEEDFSFFFDASFGTIYPALSKMERQNLISKETVHQKGKPDKNVFTITTEGMEQFNHYLKQPAEREVLRSDFLMHLYFGDMTDKDTLNNLLRREIEDKQAIHDQLAQKLKDLDGKLSPHQKLCIEIGMTQYSAAVDKLQSVLDS